MKIYTSYFGMSKKLPKEFVQIAICGKMMFPWSHPRYTKLAPRKSFFNIWKKTGDIGYYVSHFEHEVLINLTPDGVRKDLAELAGGDGKTVVLMCYETPDKFCHRHLVARWLGDVEEYDPGKHGGLK